MKTHFTVRFRGLLIAWAFAIGLMPSAYSESLTPYPLSVCIVSGDKLDKDAIAFTYQGREIKTCCTNCIDEFYKDPAGYAAKIDEAAKRANN